MLLLSIYHEYVCDLLFSVLSFTLNLLHIHQVATCVTPSLSNASVDPAREVPQAGEACSSGSQKNSGRTVETSENKLSVDCRD